jgi:hypothetical protein
MALKFLNLKGDGEEVLTLATPLEGADSYAAACPSTTDRVKLLPADRATQAG